jgi:hypothetical protein
MLAAFTFFARIFEQDKAAVGVLDHGVLLLSDINVSKVPAPLLVLAVTPNDWDRPRRLSGRTGGVDIREV